MALGRRKETMAVDEKVVAFPLSGRTATVRRCASELEDIHGEAAVSYWRTECRSLADSIVKLGCDEDDIREQVMAFQTEVQVEMMRRYSDRLAEQAGSERFGP